MARLRVFVSCLCALAAFAAVPLAGQSIKGAFAGTITDASGAVIPGAAVIITNAASGALVFKGTAGAQGSWLATAVPVGVYTLTFESAGFKRVEIRDVALKVDERVRVDARLDPGIVTEQITVSGETFGQLKTESSSLNEVINVAQMQNLPLPGGGRGDDVLNVLMLVGGVSAGGNGTRINAQQISINGSRTLNTEITVDGVSILSGTTGSITMMPAREAIREVKVLTSAYSAEYGRTSGGYVNAVVDSGTAQYRGALYEYFRNEALNANNYFNNARRVARPRDRFNQFGGKLGGPVYLPKLYNGRDHTFFFFNYEGLRLKNPAAPISTLPDERFRAGDFSASPVVLRDAQGSAPFPGNRIPDTRIDPAARRILGFVPLPNSAGTPDAANGRLINNYVYPQSVSEYINSFTGRLDHLALEGRSRLFLRVTQYDQSRPVAATVPGPLNNDRGPETQVGWQTSLGYTHVLSPSLLVDGHFGLHRNNQRVDPPEFGLDPTAAFGIQRTIGRAAPNFSIAGYRALGLNNNTLRRQITNTFHYNGAVNWSARGSLIRVGAQIRRNQFNVFNPGGGWSGNYRFNGEITSPSSAANNPVHAFGDFLLGAVQSADYNLPQPLTGRRNWNLGFFIHDDWKATSRLTVNLGLRYEYESPVVVVNDLYSRIDDATGKMLVAALNASRSLNLSADKLNLAPRAGIAYSLDQRTVIRSAVGLFFGQVFSNLGGVVNHPGFSTNQNFPDLGVGVAQPFHLSEGFPLLAVQDLRDPFKAERAATPQNPLSPASQFSEINPLSSIYQWNFGIQRWLPGAIVVDSSYVGSRGLHLPLALPTNPPAFHRAEEIALAGTGVATQLARPFPAVAGYSPRYHAGTSSYHSLQLKATREFSAAASFLATYTFAKAIDDGSGFSSVPNGADAGQFPSLFRYLDRAVGGFDRKHNFTAAVLYAPKGTWRLRGWQFSPTFVARTGLPDTIAQSSLYPGVTQQRPNASSGASIYASQRTSEGTAIRYLLDPRLGGFPYTPSGPLVARLGGQSRVVLPAALGTLGRNTIREPGEFNIDLAVSRRFPLKERMALQLRGEAFNLLNHTNLLGGNVDLAVGVDASGRPVFNAPSFGLITGARPARFMQLVLRLEF
jgi:hypothetical protein